MSLGQVPTTPKYAANTLSAPRYPQGLEVAKFLPAVSKAGIILAGGLHPAIKTEYFHIGHMGACTIGDILATVGAVEQGLAESGYSVPTSGVAAALRAYYQA